MNPTKVEKTQSRKKVNILVDQAKRKSGLREGGFESSLGTVILAVKVGYSPGKTKV